MKDLPIEYHLLNTVWSAICHSRFGHDIKSKRWPAQNEDGSIPNWMIFRTPHGQFKMTIEPVDAQEEERI